MVLLVERSMPEIEQLNYVPAVYSFTWHFLFLSIKHSQLYQLHEGMNTGAWTNSFSWYVSNPDQNFTHHHTQSSEHSIQKF